jgi:hypothetical protein
MTNKSKLHPFTATFIAALTLGACSSTTSSNEPGNEYLDGVPELAAVQLSITSDPATEGVATEADAVDPVALASDEFAATLDSTAVGTPDLNGARAAVREINQSLRDSLLPIAAMVRNTPPSLQRADVRMWGPVTRGLTEYRFLMVHPTEHVFKWRLDARASGVLESFSRVAAGELAVGIAPRRGAGIAGFDLNALGSVDPNVTARGTILAGFAHGERGTTLALGVRGLARDTSEPGVDALLQEVRLAHQISRIRLAYRGNLESTASDAQELVFARVRHSAGVGGRSDMLATSGDVPEGHAWVVSQCWDAALSQGYRIVRDCSIDDIDGASCTVISTVGDNSACDANLRLPEFPPVDPNQSMNDAQNPNADVTPPAAIPDVAADSTDAG